MADLNLIYHFTSAPGQATETFGGRYKVLFFFSPSGPIEKSQLTELAKTVPDADHAGLTFLNLDDLKEFALRVAQELQSNSTRLISVQDYNIGMDGAKDIAGYREIFAKFGEEVFSENQKKKKGLLGKFFS